MDLSARPAATVKLVGGRLCLDFLNTVGGRRKQMAGRRGLADSVIILNDKLNDYFDLLAWSRHAAVIDEAELQLLVREAKRREQEAAKVFARTVKLREAIYRICQTIINHTKPLSLDLELFNEELLQARSHERLSRLGSSFTWEWTAEGNALDQILWPIVRSAAELFTTGDLTRLRECGGEDCRWIFEDNSRNRSRQWCTMQDCGNVAKVRRFRSRHRDDGEERN